MDLLAFVAELKRRRVFRVGTVYLVAGLALIEAAANVLPALHLPDWTVTFVVALVGLGFPVALALAWAFDVTPEGIRRSSPFVGDGRGDTLVSPPGPGGRGFAYIGVGLLLTLAGFAVYARFGGTSPSAGSSAATPPGQPSDPAAGPPEAARSSVAVLPFVNMSGSADNEYFSDGITEEILNAVAHIPGLRVAGRTSSFAFKGRNADLREIARQLNVGTLLGGSVQRAGDRVRITAQLVDALTGYQVWSDRYDRDLKDVFAVEDEIGRAIAAALQVELGPNGAVHSAAGTENVRAHELYLLGLAQWNLRAAQTLRAAADYFQRAIAQDSTYAQAHAGLALTWALFSSYGAGTNDVYGPRAEVAARTALALDSMLGDAHAALAFTLGYTKHDWDAGLTEAGRAVAIDPNNATAHNFRGLLLTAVGRFPESRAQYDRAIELDPLSIGVRVGFCVTLFRQHDYLRAGLECERAARVPSALPSEYLTLIDLAQGRFPEAGAALHTWAEVAGIPDPSQALVVTGALAGTGSRAQALAVLDGWTALSPALVHRTLLADLYTQLGERGAALDALDVAYDVRDPTLVAVLTDPLLDPLRSEPRLQALLRRMNLANVVTMP